MKFLLSLTIIYFTLFSFVFGQDDLYNEYLMNPPDTFKTYKPAEIKYVETLDSVNGNIFDSILNPTAYFIDTYKPGKGYSWCIALKKENHYLVFNPFENSDADCSLNDLSFERKNFNDCGNEELIILWNNTLGHTGWESAIYEKNKGELIWDLDSLTKLFDFQNYYSFESWWTTYAPDSTDTLDYSEREVLDTGGESFCENFIIKIDKKKLTIQYDNDCQILNGNIEQKKTDNKIYIYKLTDKGLIKQN
ncbi:MAG: hypothetical protein K9J13_10890 [Saprospiraceae bacterium]|nr:hypothetical protein [Saprospiraceae bacterium]